MASRVIVRGAKVNYVNSNGFNALHIFVETKNIAAIKFLFKMGADPHIMDLTGEDACDKAKKNGLCNVFKEF